MARPALLYYLRLRYYIWVVFVLLLEMLEHIEGGPHCNNIEECLVKRLLDNHSYDIRARPLPSYTEDVPVQVVVRLDLYRLIDVDAKQGKISLHTFIYENWLEPRLAWNPAEFGNITSIAINNENLWVPDMTLINAAINSDNRPPKGLAKVQTLYDPITRRWSNARVLLSYPTILEPFCYMNTHYFPFDRQVCMITLGSNSHDASKLELHAATDYITLERFENFGEWHLSDLRMDEDYVFYNCCRLPFCQLNARIVITRKPLYYIVNLILPTLITNILATIGLFSNLKIFGGELTAATVGLTTLLAFSILLMSISEQMPRGSQWISLMGCFFVGIIVQTCVATVTAVYLMRTDRRNRFKRIFCARDNGNFKMSSNEKLKVTKINLDTSNVETDENKENSDGAKIDREVENWCMCFHIVFTLTFTVAVLMVGTVNAYVI